MRVVSRAWWYAVPVAVLAIPAFLVGVWATLALLAIAATVLLFFRDPERSPPPRGFLAPADGRVSVVRVDDDRVRVGVFMNVTDVHVNRSPISGTVTSVEHRPGAHRPAFSKDSDRNERVRFHIEGAHEIEVDLIAGAFARRITPYVAEGDEVTRGERIGHIAFGSRADVLLPPSVELADVRIGRGSRVRAGESIVAPTDP